MKFISLIQGSSEWFEYRRTRIGASESSVILGLSPFSTPFKLWEEKLYGKSVQTNSSMRRGLEREEESRLWLCNHFGMNFSPRVVEHKQYGWKFASLDALSYNNVVLVEIKWANSVVHSLAKKGKVVDYYYPQIQSQLACAGLEVGYFLSCFEVNDEPEFILVEVKRDDLFIEKLIEKEGEFYQRCLVELQPPEMTDKDYREVEDSTYFDYMCAEYLRLSESIAAMEREKKSFYESILLASNKMSSKSEGFKATKFKVKGSVDYSMVKELENVDLDRYRKGSSERWKISKV